MSSLQRFASLSLVALALLSTHCDEDLSHSSGGAGASGSGVPGFLGGGGSAGTGDTLPGAGTSSEGSGGTFLGGAMGGQTSEAGGGAGAAMLPKGDCCASNDSPGCLDTSVEQCVCDQMDGCCAQTWGEACVQAVEALGCGSCGPGPVPETTIAACGDGEDNDGDGYVDCEDSGCCSLINCAKVSPGSYCAQQNAGGADGAGGAAGKAGSSGKAGSGGSAGKGGAGGATCQACAEDTCGTELNDCASDTSSPSCEDCSVNPELAGCSSNDALLLLTSCLCEGGSCGDSACKAQCDLLTGGTGGASGKGGAGGSGSGPVGTCCTEQTGKGCSNAAIQECVCAQDSYCCTDLWDSVCVGRVDELACGTCS